MDAEVINMGGTFVFRLDTDAAREFVSEHVHTEPWQWLGPDSFAVDGARMGRDIGEAMLEHGLVVT